MYRPTTPAEFDRDIAQVEAELKTAPADRQSALKEKLAELRKGRAALDKKPEKPAPAQ
jgi:hypothetical protein